MERISTRGWDKLGVPQAKALIDEGQAGVNEVAAVPSLHAAISMLITVFFWPRLRKRWRPLLLGYALVMAFSLVYSAEHFVFDILLGWLLTGLVSYGFHRWENRGRADRRADSDSSADPDSVRPIRTRENRRTRGRYPGRVASSPSVEEFEFKCRWIAMTPSSAWPSAGASCSRLPRSTAEPVRPGTTVRSASS